MALGDARGAQAQMNDTLKHLTGVDAASGDLIGEVALLRILASVGTQMAGFIHEINGLVGTADSVDRAIRRLRAGKGVRTRDETNALNTVTTIVSDMKRSLERQASYLLDVVTPDARRRRKRQSFAERFDAGGRLVALAAEARGIRLENKIPKDLMSPPMFPAELTTVFSNLLSNAVKAAGRGGRVRATGRRTSEGAAIRIENSGAAVDPKAGERWFRPFESSTTEVDAVLGQGMGLGLPITRSVLLDYGGTIKFVESSPQFETAIEFVLPVPR